MKIPHVLVVVGLIGLALSGTLVAIALQGGANLRIALTSFTFSALCFVFAAILRPLVFVWDCIVEIWLEALREDTEKGDSLTEPRDPDPPFRPSPRDPQ